MPASAHRRHVVIVGGGVAGVELALALHDLAGSRVRMTLVAPQRDVELHALRTAEPFAADQMPRHSLKDLTDRVSAELISDTAVAVHPERHTVRLAETGTLRYDELVLAVGARHRTAFSRAITFTGDSSTLPYNGLLADLEEHWTHSVAFVVPPGTTWPLPLYELALMTAQQVRSMGIDDARLELVTPEATPLTLFGPRASQAVANLLERAGVSFRGATYARSGPDGHLELLPSGDKLDAERVVSLPTIEGPQIGGVPGDELGFIPVDAHGRVRGLDNVYAAGDGTTFPVKQGGLACQQADAIAELLAAAAGADVDPTPFRPVLRGRLLTDRGAQYLEQPLHGGAGTGPASELRLWSAPRKVDGRYLSPWLEELAGHTTPSDTHEEKHMDVEVELPAMSDNGSDDVPLVPGAPVPAG